MSAPRRPRSKLGRLNRLLPPQFSRRHILKMAGAGFAMAALPGCGDSGGRAIPASSGGGGVEPPPPNAINPFVHGVATGDPLSDRVIFWTRATPVATEDIVVTLQVFTDAALTQAVGNTTAMATAARDWTIKIDFAGLAPGTTYYYRFMALGFSSPVGRTRTAPVGDVSRMRFGVVSCSSLAHGFFNAYRFLAARADIDVVLHLGDYIYEYGSGEYGNVRAYEPATEMTSLADYRTRHAQYKRVDTDLQEVHRQHPFITIWDDHESTDNSWRDGANNHTEGAEGQWPMRKGFAQQAYDEWMPIRLPEPGNPARIWRKFSFGRLMDLVMLDTRLFDRDEQLGLPIQPNENPAAADRTLIGPDQMQFLKDSLTQSPATWKFIGQQVMFGQLKVVGTPNSVNNGGQYLNGDQWDAYQVERTEIFNHLRAGPINNAVVLTGDIHTSWAMDLTPDPNNPVEAMGGYNPTTGGGSLAVEYVCTSVTSPGLDQLATAQDAISGSNPHIKYVDLERKGYMVFDVTPTRTVGEWWYVSTIATQGGTEAFATAFPVANGANRLGAALTAPTTPRANAPAPAPAAV